MPNAARRLFYATLLTVQLSEKTMTALYENYPYVIRKCTPEKGIPSIQITFAGWLCGLDALNAAGLATTHGSVGSISVTGECPVTFKIY